MLSANKDQNITSSGGSGSHTSADGAKHKPGYNSRWEANHTWIFYVEGEGMYCKLSRKFDTRNRQKPMELGGGGGGLKFTYITYLIFFFGEARKCAPI